MRVTGIARIETKTTQAKSFSVTREMVAIVERAGMCNDEVPAVIVEFLNAAGKPEAELAVIPVSALEWLIANARS